MLLDIPVSVIGESAEMRRVYELIEKVAHSDSTVLIQGESGTGKEVVAKAIHRISPRADKPFIPINCGAIPEALLESELFGHEKGSFTGANNTRLGRFELAHNGTLFFDEVSEMPYPLQVKLLRAVQEREIERIGGTKSIAVNVRILAATNVDLEQAVLEKRFRKDLYYRLNVIPVNLPPLRKRKEDIPILVAHFIEQLNGKRQKRVAGLSQEATDCLLAYSWPGNIRELENIIERVVILKDEGMVTREDLPEKIAQAHPMGHDAADADGPLEVVHGAGQNGGFSPSSHPAGMSDQGSGIPIPDEGIDFAQRVEAFENQLIQEALKKANGVKSRAAQLLRLNRTTLVEKLKRRGIGEVNTCLS